MRLNLKNKFDNREDYLNHYFSKIKDNLHIVLNFSPLGDIIK